MVKNCKTCSSGHAPTNNFGILNVNQKTLLCRRYPPIPMLIPLPGGAQIASQWPPVTEETVCREWEPKE